MKRFILLVAACASHGPTAATGGFRVTYPDAANARVKAGGKLYFKPSAQCAYDDGKDAHWAITGAHVTGGALPPGVTIEDGVVTGTAQKPGDYTATLTITGVTCAGKPYPDQTADVHVTVK